MQDRLKRWAQGLARSRDALLDKMTGLTGGLDEDTWEQLEEMLVAADVGAELAMNLVEEIKPLARGERWRSTGDLVEGLAGRLERMLGEASRQLDLEHRPAVISVVGVNGVGKTTTIGKLAYRLRNQGKSVIVAASDTFRAAATEQIKEWASRAGADLVSQGLGADPASVAFDALQAARARGHDVLIVDTAGRLHTRKNLMEELKKVHRVLERQLPGCPHEVLLVLDATTGQNSIHQARLFQEAVGVTGLVLTKLDGTARGGTVIAIESQLGLPVKFVGLGEKLEDLEPFDPRSFVRALFGLDA